MGTPKRITPLTPEPGVSIGQGRSKIQIETVDGEAVIRNGPAFGGDALVSLSSNKGRKYFGINDPDVLDGTSAPAANGVITSTNGKVNARKFDSSSAEDLRIPWKLPDNIKVSAPMNFQVDTVITNATGPSAEGMSFKLSMYGIADGGALNGTFGTEYESNKTAMTQAQNTIARTVKSSDIDISSMAPGTMAMLKFQRDPTDTDDDYGQDVGVTGFELEYTINKELD